MPPPTNRHWISFCVSFNEKYIIYIYTVSIWPRRYPFYLHELQVQFTQLFNSNQSLQVNNYNIILPVQRKIKTLLNLFNTLV